VVGVVTMVNNDFCCGVGQWWRRQSTVTTTVDGGISRRRWRWLHWQSVMVVAMTAIIVLVIDYDNNKGWR